ncbi:MAG: exo-alpha-sialidase [SAR202 cluster bacterium]|nr:exo-alpha-sialidase [SAR202 cluster bacterium]
MKLVVEGVISRRKGRGAYMAAITSLPDGNLIACQFVGKSLASSDNHIEVLRSVDGGATWSNEGSTHGGGPPADGWAYRAPHIYAVPGGRLMLTATRFDTSRQAQTFDPKTHELQHPELLIFWSDDVGRTWSSPQVIPVPLPRERYTTNGAGVFFQLAPDRWMYPIETWKPVGYKGPPDQMAAALFSSDQGRTWGELTVVAHDPAHNLLYWDHTGTVLPDGRIYIMAWTHRYSANEDLPNHYVVSSDQGRTWSQPMPTNLPGQACAPVALPDGRVVTIYNHRRQPAGVRAAVTRDLVRYDLDNEVVLFDAGKEDLLGSPDPSNVLAVNMAQGFGKPGGVLLPDGAVMAYYWGTVDGISHTRWARLQP